MSTTGFVPRWGKHSSNNVTKSTITRSSPLAQDVVPHVPYTSKETSMKSPPPGMYNQPRSHLEPLMKPMNSPGSLQSKTKRDEMWERKRHDFLVRSGRSPPTTTSNSGTVTNNKLAPSNHSVGTADVNRAKNLDFEAAVQALVQKQNQQLAEELKAVTEDTVVNTNNAPVLQNKAPSPSEPRYNNGHANIVNRDAIPMQSLKENSYLAKNNGNILSPPKSRLGARLSSMHLDMDAQALERKKKAEYRYELEQQMSARASSKRGGRNSNVHYSSTNSNVVPVPQTSKLNHSPPIPPQYQSNSGSNSSYDSKADLQLRYKQELDKQIALKKSERERNLKQTANPSSRNTIAFPATKEIGMVGGEPSTYHTANSSGIGMSKADRMRQYKMELDQQIQLKKQQEMEGAAYGSPGGMDDRAGNIYANAIPAYLQQEQYNRRYGRQKRDYRMDLDKQMAMQQQLQQRQEVVYNDGEDMFSKLGNHELHVPASRPFGAGGINTLHNDHREIEKYKRVKARKSKYMEDLDRQIEQRNEIRKLDDGSITQKPMASPRINRNQRQHLASAGLYNSSNNNYDLPVEVRNRYENLNSNANINNPYLQQMKQMDAHNQQFQRQTPLFRSENASTIHTEHSVNFSGYGAKRNLVDIHDASAKLRAEQMLHRQNELARKKDYGQELKQQMREKKAREDLTKTKRLEEEVKLMAKLKQKTFGGKVAAVLGSSAGSGGGGGEPVREGQVPPQNQRLQNQPNAFGVPAQRSISFHQSDLRNNNGFNGQQVERQHSAQAAFTNPPMSQPLEQSLENSRNISKDFSRQRSGELHPGIEDYHEIQRKQQQQHQFRATLKEQVEETKRRKAEQKRLEKEAEEKEAARIQRELDEMNRKYRQEKEKTIEASPKSALDSNGPVAFSPKHVPQQHHPVVPQSFSINNQNARPLNASSTNDNAVATVNVTTTSENVAFADDHPATKAFRREMEDRQRQLQEELQQQKDLVFEMQQKMQMAMSLSRQQRSNYDDNKGFANENSTPNNKAASTNRRQWKSPVNAVLPTFKSTESLSVPVDNSNYNMAQVTANARVSISNNSNSSSSNRKSDSALQKSNSARRLRTPVVPDEAFVSRPKLINSLDVSSISEMLAQDHSFQENSSLESSIAGHSKLVQAFVEAGDPLDKTWLMPQASPSPMRNTTMRNSFTRNRNSLVEQSLQSSSHFVPLDGEHKDIHVIDADEQLLTAFANKVMPGLPAVKEETNSPTASDLHNLPTQNKTSVVEEKNNGTKNDTEASVQKDVTGTTTKTSNKPSPAMKTIANFLEVDPMLSPSVHDNSDMSHMPPPQTPPRESLNKKVVNENTMFQVNTPSREEWQEMLNSSQLSATGGIISDKNNDGNGKNDMGDMIEENINEDESSLNLTAISDNVDLNNTQIENVLNSTVLSEVEEEAMI